MNNSFSFVSQCQLNNSRSKETHQFAKARRFLPTKPPPCSQSAYDLSKTMFTSTITHKSTIMDRDLRFKSSATISPPPNAYLHHSFADINRSTERGTSFSHDAKLVHRNKNLCPGPGEYQPQYNPQTKLSYTMRSKITPPDKGNKLGPGQYQTENYHAINKPTQISSKYNNPKNYVMGQAYRFKPRAHETIGPGPYAQGRVKTDMGVTTTYSFGRTRKEPSYIPKTFTPGPNSYHKFSEFSELKNGIGLPLASKTISYQ